MALQDNATSVRSLCLHPRQSRQSWRIGAAPSSCRCIAGPERRAVHERQRAPGTGAGHRQQGQSADGASHGQSRLDVSFRRCARANARRFRQTRRASHPSGTARLAGSDVCGERLVDEEAAQADPAFQRLSAEQHGTAKAFALDPENRLLSHQNRQRLDLEALRDSLLSVSGQAG